MSSRSGRPVAQLHITRPDGTMLVQGVADRAHILGWLRQLAPLVPLDATWQVLGPDERP